MVFGEPAEMAAYEELVLRFESKNPGITVELDRVPNQFAYRLQLDEDYVLGEPADVIVVNYRRFAKYASKHLLEPLGPLLRQSSVIQPDDFYPKTLEAFQWNGELTCIPQNFSGLVVYYNKELFDAANVPYPHADWTWQDFLDAATRLTLDTNGDGQVEQHGLGTEANLVRVAPFIWMNGGEIVDRQVQPTRFVFDSPAASETMQFLTNLLVKNRVVPNSTEEIMESFESRFIHGRMAMFVNSRRGVGLYREQANFDWDVAPLPVGKTKADLLQADGYCLPSSSKNKEAAWKLIEYASSPEGQEILMQAGRMVPPLKALAESDKFIHSGTKPSDGHVFLNSMDAMRLFPIDPFWWEVEEIAGENLERAFHGDIPVQEGIERAIDRTLPYFAMP
jgi:multiple sugar transport system substrate-binding protein